MLLNGVVNKHARPAEIQESPDEYSLVMQTLFSHLREVFVRHKQENLMSELIRRKNIRTTLSAADLGRLPVSIATFVSIFRVEIVAALEERFGISFVQLTPVDRLMREYIGDYSYISSGWYFGAASAACDPGSEEPPDVYSG